MKTEIETTFKTNGQAARSRLMGVPDVIVKAAPVKAEIRDVLNTATFPTKFMSPADWIILQVSAKHDVTEIDMKSKRRDRPAVRARQEAMYRMRYETTMSFPAIGKKFGGRDHTTALHSVRKWKALMQAAIADEDAQHAAEWDVVYEAGR